MCLHSRITIRSGAYSSNEGDFGQLPLYDTRPWSRGLFLNLTDNLTFEKIAVALSREDIEYIAHLARLEVSEPDVPAYADKLGRIIEFIDELGQADTAALVPMAHPLDMSQRLRVDEVTETSERDRYQANAPETENGLYVVPRVVE
jgi:aspartyl-tRNA(Asn)/glutamyl-tRNA(Gln) amidotransferase subunit C